MIILTLRTDKPEAEIGLYDNRRRLSYLQWQAHRELAETIHTKINELLKEQGLELSDVEAIAIYKGPGSFTGLRIGFSVANALADSLSVPVIAAESDSWIEDGIDLLHKKNGKKIELPDYGSEPRTTTPKK